MVDIAVDPAFQKQGLSRIVMEEIMKFIDERLPKSCWVTLFADVDFLYKKFGFVNSEKSQGMHLIRK